VWRQLTIFTWPVSLAVSLPAIAAHFDLVIKNGRIMDPETYDMLNYL